MNSLDELVLVLDRLIARMDELESRISALEHRSLHSAASSNDGSKLLQPASLTVTGHPLEQVLSPAGSGLAPAIGKIFLGLAGAYILRALSESGIFPQLAIVAVGLAYVATWLVWAARAGDSARFAAGAYAVTAALILSPMLWELTVRFKVLPSPVTALLLVGFASAGTALARNRDRTAISWLTGFAAVATSLALFITTRDPAPFTLALVAIATVMEAAACLGQCMGTRMIVATALDLAVAAVIVVYTSAQAVPAEYIAIRAGLLLAIFAAPLAIYGSSTVVRAVAQRREISPFDIAQTTIAFLLAWVGIGRATHGTAIAVIGAFAVVLAAACYAVAFTRFEDAAHTRNYHAFATWAVALAVMGGWALLPTGAFVAALSVAAVGASFLAVRFRKLPLAFHGAAFLAVAAFVSGFLVYTADELLSSAPTKPALSVVIVLAASFLCYAAVWGFTGDQWQCRAVRLVFAATALLALAASEVFAIASVWSGAASGAALAALRTLVICGAALLLGVVGAQWRRVELVWLAYASLAGCTLKILFEDLRSGSAAAMAIALFAYGTVWVLLPRCTRSRA